MTLLMAFNRWIEQPLIEPQEKKNKKELIKLTAPDVKIEANYKWATFIWENRPLQISSW